LLSHRHSSVSIFLTVMLYAFGDVQLVRMGKLNRVLYAALIAFLCRVVWSRETVFAWISGRIRRGRNALPANLPIGLTASKWRFAPVLLAMKQSDVSDQKYSDEQNEINSRIYSVASTICNLSSQQLNIEWKPNRIVVTVNVDQAYIDATDEANDTLSIEDNDFDSVDEFFDTEEIEIPMTIVNEMDDAVEGGLDFESETNSVDDKKILNGGVDLTLLARSINTALDDDGQIGSQIAERYEIEVTTPGVSDELTSSIMFTAYRGFDVLVQHQDPKTKKSKTFEGRLVERNADFVVLNIKGRLKHLKNSDVMSVKLPKAKKEKGVG
jgi:ribosome maturation factor RimP